MPLTRYQTIQDVPCFSNEILFIYVAHIFHLFFPPPTQTSCSFAAPWDTPMQLSIAVCLFHFPECTSKFKKFGRKRQRDCVFPFKYKGNTYSECIVKDYSFDGKPRCPYKIDSRGRGKKWAVCEPGCPGMGKKQD